MVEIYNKSMGGVDLCDMLLSFYRVRRRINKYYTHIVYYLIGISITNGWLLYRRHQQQNKVPAKDIKNLLSFQTDEAFDLCLAYKPVTQKKGRPSLESLETPPPKKISKPATVPNPTNETRFDQTLIIQRISRDVDFV